MTYILINIYSGNSVLPDGTKLITGPMLTLTTTHKHLWYTKQNMIILHQAKSSWKSACKMSTILLSGAETNSIWVKNNVPSHIRGLVCQKVSDTGLILCLRQVNERRRNKVTPSPIGWAQTWNQPWINYIPQKSVRCNYLSHRLIPALPHKAHMAFTVINPTSLSLPHNFKVCNRCTESPRRIQCWLAWNSAIGDQDPHQDLYSLSGLMSYR